MTSFGRDLIQNVWPFAKGFPVPGRQRLELSLTPACAAERCTLNAERCNRERRTVNRERPTSARSGRPANPIHDRLAETHFWHWLEEDPLDVHLVHLSQ